MSKSGMLAFASAAAIVASVATADSSEAAASDVYTGCVGPGGNLIHVAVGMEPKKPCKGPFTEVTWNEAGPAGPPGLDGQDGVSGWQVIEVTQIFSSWAANEVKTINATCPSGKKLLGGGVQFPATIGQFAVKNSFPVPPAYVKWEGTVQNLGATYNQISVWAVFAIFANITL